MVYIVCGLIALSCLTLLLSPFWLGEGGSLAASSTISDTKRLETIQEAIVAQYAKEEKALEAKAITSREWRKRKEFLENRYLDAAQRLDFLKQKGPN